MTLQQCQSRVAATHRKDPPEREVQEGQKCKEQKPKEFSSIDEEVDHEIDNEAAAANQDKNQSQTGLPENAVHGGCFESETFPGITTHAAWLAIAFWWALHLLYLSLQPRAVNGVLERNFSSAAWL